MTITARFSSVCPRCHQPIHVGEHVEWSKGSPATHVNCQPAPVVVADSDDEAYDAYRAFQRSQPRATLTLDHVGAWFDPTTSELFLCKKVLDKTSDRVLARKFEQSGSRRLTNGGTRLLGRFIYEDDQGNHFSQHVATLIAAGKLVKIGADNAEQFAITYGVCAQCGRFLSDAESVEAVIGPICAKKLGINRKALIAAHHLQAA